MKWSLLFSVLSLTLLFFLAGPLQAAGEPSALKEGMDSIFIKFQKDFDRIAASAEIKKSAVAPVNRLFLKSLKKHQPYFSLVRTNKKGIVINEVIRMVEKPSTKKQDMSKEDWFTQISKKKEAYQTILFQSETGRYHLFWATPIISKGKKGKETFNGAVVLKIDLWDCFFQFSKDKETPFLIRLEKKNLYSNKWNDASAYAQEPLAVPGVEKISLRYPKAGGFAEAQAPEIQAADSNQIKAAEDSAKAAQAKHGKSGKGAIFLIVLMIIAAGVVVFKLVSARRYNARMDDLNKDVTSTRDDKPDPSSF